MKERKQLKMFSEPLDSSSQTTNEGLFEARWRSRGGLMSWGFFCSSGS